MANTATQIAFAVRLSTVLRSNLRLNAAYYSTEVYRALRLLEESGYPSEKLGSIVEDVFLLPRIKRTFVESEELGWPYLAPTDLVMFRPMRHRFVLRDVKNHERFFVKEGWLLITRSGTIGRVIYATKRLERYFITDDVIRVVCGPSGKVLPGYLCAYLTSWVGNTLLTKDEYGMTVRHIEPEHVREIPIPILPSDVQREIHEMIVRAWEMRDEAIELEDEAIRLVEEKVIGAQRPKSAQTVFTIRARQILQRGDYRLDAGCYCGDVTLALKAIEECGHPLKKLGDPLVTQTVFHLPRFDRTFVDDERLGWPYLAPMDIVMYRPLRRRFILRDVKNPERFFVKEGWLLITCSGSVGRVVYATKSLERYFITHDIIRVVCREDGLVLPGYLYAYLWSWAGNALLTRDEYGMTVRHIEPEHVREIPVPIPPKDVQQKIHGLVVEAWRLREQANELEDKAVKLLLDELYNRT